MYISYIVNELKKWTRDPMMLFMMFYPIVFGAIGRYLLPWLVENSGFNLEYFTDLILVFLTLFMPLIFGALVGFSILDDRDDNILTSIKVTPLSLNQFLSFKLVLVFLLSFFGTTFILWFSNVGSISVGNMFAISFLSSLAAPMTGLFINSFAQNKIEGFAVMKGAGMIIIFPVISLFFVDKRELLFSFAPGFWPAKAISSLVRGNGALLMNYSQYYLIGLAYIIVLNVGVYRLFVQRTKL